MALLSRLPLLSILTLTLSGCASTLTEDEVVPIYESPCAVFDAGSACDTPPDENGSYIAAWSSLSCMDVCDALNADQPHPLVACGPIHPAGVGEEHMGFEVVSCIFDAENYQ